MMKKSIATMLLGLLVQAAPAEDLAAVYEIAFDYDAQLRAAGAVRDAQYEAKPLARSGLLPQIGVYGDLAHENRNVRESSTPSIDGDWNSGTLGVSLTQPLFRRDRLVRMKQADWQLEQADADYAIAQQDLVLRVAAAYFSVLDAEEGVTFIRAEKKAIERQLDQAKQRFEVGLIAITGVHEAQARYDQANTDEILQLNALDQTWEELREIIGVKPEKVNTLKETIPLEPPMPADVDAWRTMALENNPIIKSASDATQVAQKEIDVQYSGHYPTLDLVASYGASRFDADYLNDADNGRVAVELNVPIYTGGGVTAATRQARHLMIATQEQLDQARRAVDKDVRNAYREVHASISAVRSLQAGIVSAQSSVEATEAGFEVGTRTLVDVLNEQRDLYAAKRDYARARYTYVLRGLQLKLAAGVLKEEDIREINSLLDNS
jgi:outer membrane protein